MNIGLYDSVVIRNCVLLDLEDKVDPNIVGIVSEINKKNKAIGMVS